MRNDDTRCCGTGTCMINAQGVCWCGQRWDGEKMCPPATQQALAFAGQSSPATDPVSGDATSAGNADRRPPA